MGKAGLHRSTDLVQIDTLDHSRMNDDEVERTSSLAVTSKPTSLAWVWNEMERLVQCSSEYHLFHEIALSQSSIELLLRHHWWHICLRDEREHWSISVEQGSWSESLQQEVIWLADFKTYATSFSSLQSFTKRLNICAFLMRGYGTGLSHIKRCGWAVINVMPRLRNAFCYQSTGRINTRILKEF